MKQIALRISDELATQIDTARGQVPRERWIRSTLAAALSGDTQAGVPRADDGHDTRDTASATGAVTVRGASRPAASPRTPPFSAQQANMDRQTRLNKAKGM